MVVGPVTRKGSAGQLVLFGDHEPPAPAQPAPRARVSDDDLIEAVGRAATHPGYVVLGAAEHVHLRDVEDPRGQAVIRVPRYEHDTVHQLISDGVLKIGGQVNVTDRGNHRRAAIVVMPNHIRPTFEKWCRGRRRHRATRTARPGTPEPPSATDPTPDAGPASTSARQPSGLIHVGVVRPGLGLVTCGPGELSGSITRQDGRYLVRTEHGEVIGRANSYRTGAQRLARHHGFTPGPVEIDHETDIPF